jgi:NADPH:quinone reductase-like Zn-dependent oxidoreductase
VQIAKADGATVTGVYGTAKTELVRSIGADHVIDYTRDEFADGRNRYDVILDIAGNRPLSQLRRALTPQGTLVIVGAEDAGNWLGIRRQLRAAALSPFVNQKLGFFISKERSQDLEELRKLLQAGTIRPVLDRTFPLDQVPEAIRYLRDGRARGKVVITV